jgi:hypothetical protein
MCCQMEHHHIIKHTTYAVVICHCWRMLFYTLGPSITNSWSSIVGPTEVVL